ncbi:MAG: PKD domain-containing protein [Thermoanaerobaculia bacterium]
MKITMTHARFARVALLAFAALATVVEQRLDAQCPTGTTIPNFRFVSSTAAPPRQITYAWDAPAGAPAGTVYEFLRQTAPDYCSAFTAFQVVAETTATSQTVTLDNANTAYQFFVRVKGCNTVAATGTWVDDSFLSPPTAPVISAAAGAPGTVVIQLTQNDARTVAQGLERADASNQFTPVNLRYFDELCPAGSVKTFTDTGLAAGTYTYRAWALNQGTSQRVYSSSVTVTVGGGSCTLACSAVVPAAGSSALGVTFRASASASGCGGVPTYAWSFGDGGGSTSATAVHAYPGAGTYTWTLTVSVAGGQNCVRTGTISIANAPPIIDFFAAASTSISAGQSTTLSWSTSGATTVQIDPTIGAVQAVGSATVAPLQTTTYTLLAASPSGSTFRRVTIFVTPAGGTQSISTIPTVVSAPGFAGAYFRTSLQLNNLSGAPIYGRLIYHPRETSGSDADPFLVYALAPGQTLEYKDLLLALGVSGNGSLDIVADSGALPVAYARVYNDAGGLGTTGVTEQAMPAGAALAIGDVGVLIAPSDFGNFRFNMGIRTLAAGASVTFTVRDANGVVQKIVTRSFPGTYYIQQTASDFLEGYAFTGNESIVVSVGSGSAFVYGTVADNRTNDPSIQFATRAD